MHLLSFQAPQHPKKETRTTNAEMTTMMYPAEVYKEMSAASNPSHESPQASLALSIMSKKEGLSTSTQIPHPRTTNPRI